MTKPVLYMDFDGVVNFFGSRSRHRRESKLGYLRRNSVAAFKNAAGELEPTAGWGQYAFPLNWSGELTRKLGSLDADWLWLTSWKNFAPELLDPLLDVQSAGWLDWNYSAATGYNHAYKFHALLADQDANPRPFVWVDDEATAAFDEDAFLTPVPHLLLRPNDEVGMTHEDLAAIIAFVAEHGGA